LGHHECFDVGCSGVENGRDEATDGKSGSGKIGNGRWAGNCLVEGVTGDEVVDEMEGEGEISLSNCRMARHLTATAARLLAQVTSEYIFICFHGKGSGGGNSTGERVETAAVADKTASSALCAVEVDIAVTSL
jgi:hypothetical protein